MEASAGNRFDILVSMDLAGVFDFEDFFFEAKLISIFCQ
jgi:hypothetical protein